MEWSDCCEERYLTNVAIAHSGANGLAAPRDFQTPVARFEDRECCFTVLHKLCGQVFEAQQSCSPFDVVAWHGNYAPYKYDLARYCPVNTVRSGFPPILTSAHVHLLSQQKPQTKTEGHRRCATLI